MTYNHPVSPASSHFKLREKMAMKTALLAAGLFLGSAQAITVEYVGLYQLARVN
jgi:hypothetical protein